MKNKYQEEINKLKEELEYLENIIDALEQLELYKCNIDYDYEENAYEVYDLFNLDEFIDDIKYMKQKQLIK